jgi:glycosyltransferase involved in cell wall biosynthesis
VDTHDVFSTKREKVLQFGVDDMHVTPHEEKCRLRHADLVLAIQEGERRELQRLLGGKPILTVGVDFDVVEDSSIPSSRTILCVGSGNSSNAKGLRDFIRFAWQQIRKDVPDAELLVVGDVGQAIAGDVPGVVRLGRVADLDPIYARARLVINPAVAGTGIKIKTLEALCHLRPIVTWPNGIEGLHPELAGLCVIVRDWYEFAQEVKELLTLAVPRQFSTTERDAVIRLTSPAAAYTAMGDAMTEFLNPHEPRG